MDTIVQHAWGWSRSLGMEELHVDYNTKGKTPTAFVAVVLGIMCLLMWSRRWTADTVVFMALVLFWNAGTLSPKDALSGFGNSGMLTIGTTYILSKVIQRTHVIELITAKAFGPKDTAQSALIKMLALVFVLSAFFQNIMVVGIVIPIARDWARARGFPTSAFLLPLSFASIMGGMCTLIGSPVNLIVDGTVTNGQKFGYKLGPLRRIFFFAPGAVAVPIGIIGLIYLAIVTPYLLKRKGSGLLRYVRDTAGELITEVEIQKDFPHIGQPVAYAVAKLGLSPDAIIKLRRPLSLATVTGLVAAQSPVNRTGDYENRTKAHWGAADDKLATGQPSSRVGGDEEEKESLTGPPAGYTKPDAGFAFNDVYPVDPSAEVQAGDILFLACPQNQMVEFQGQTAVFKNQGLKFADVKATDLPNHDTEFFELVLSSTNKFVGTGRPVPNKEFAAYYGATVLAVRSKGVTVAAAGGAQDDPESNLHAAKVEVRNHTFQAGDTLLVLAPTDFKAKNIDSMEFILITKVGELPPPVKKWDYTPLLIFIGMVAWASAKEAKLVKAAFTAGSLYIIGNWIGARKAVLSIDWALLLLVGSAMSIARTFSSSNLSNLIAIQIKHHAEHLKPQWPQYEGAFSPRATLTLVYLFSSILSEMVTPYAAAAFSTPIAVNIAAAYGASYKPFAIAVMIACSASFVGPWRYQTNTMVLNPGGYKWYDFTVVGLPLVLLYWALTIAILPGIYPFYT